MDRIFPITPSTNIVPGQAFETLIIGKWAVMCELPDKTFLVGGHPYLNKVTRAELEADHALDDVELEDDLDITQEA